MSETEFKKLMEEIETGKKRIVSKWAYIMNYWTPIFGMITFLVLGLLWFADANGRMFTDEQIKYETEQNTVAARQRTFDKLDERYVKRTEIQELNNIIKDLNKAVTDLKIELARKK